MFSITLRTEQNRTALKHNCIETSASVNGFQLSAKWLYFCGPNFCGDQTVKFLLLDLKVNPRYPSGAQFLLFFEGFTILSSVQNTLVHRKNGNKRAALNSNF